MKHGKTIRHMEQYGHQFDRPARNLETCISFLDQAYYAIRNMDLPELKKQIDAALNNANAHAIEAMDRYNEKD